MESRVFHNNPAIEQHEASLDGSGASRVLVPHPDDVADVRAGYDEAERGELISAPDSIAHVRRLLGEVA
jgi:hypothetical protein